jgi:hypothetical protein
MTFFDAQKSIIENLYFISGPILFIVGIIGLWQLRIAKNSLKINSQRASAIMAFELCDKCTKEMSPLFNIVTEELTALNVDYKKIQAMGLHSLKEIKEDDPNYPEVQKLWVNMDNFPDTLSKMADLLEGFSIPFIKKIADEEIAYNREFLKFEQYCNLCAPAIIRELEEYPHQKHLYENVIELYSIWKSRNERELLDDQVSNLIIKKSKIKIQTIKPLGVN